MKVLCVGQMGWDVTTINNQTEINYGGSVLHFSLAAALMGLKVDLLCYVNRNDWKNLLNELDTIGIGVESVIDFYDTIKFHMDYDAELNFCEDKFFMEINSHEPVIYDHLTNQRTYDLYNICETTPEQDCHTLDKIRSCCPTAKTSIQFHIDNLQKDKALYIAMLPQVDYIFMNLDEALYLSGENEIESAIIHLQTKIKNVLFITSHEKNYAIRKTEVISMNIFPAEDVVDPTGAGDCFAGGAIAGICVSDDLSVALRYGAICSYFKLKDYSSKKILDILKIGDYYR